MTNPYDAALEATSVKPCDECSGDPANTANGICTECEQGECRTCHGEGYELVRTGIDTEREVACSGCGDADCYDERDDGDARFDAMRDDELLDRNGQRDSRY